MKKLLIIGASGHAKVCADIALLNGYRDIVFLDDDTSKEECLGFPVVGTISEYNKYKDRDFFIAIGSSQARTNIRNQLKDVRIVTLIHPKAVVANGVQLGEGCVVMAGAVINSCTVIGDGTIINTCASVDHDCKIGAQCHIAVGAHVCGTVAIGNNCWIGAGATVSNNIDISQETIIGAGAVVIKDIFEHGTYIGIPAKKIRK